jgi:hypothetical protein
MPHLVRTGFGDDTPGFVVDMSLDTDPLTVEELAEKLMRIKALGMGSAQVRLPDGSAVTDVELVAAGEKPAHFVVRSQK